MKHVQAQISIYGLFPSLIVFKFVFIFDYSNLPCSADATNSLRSTFKGCPI